MTTTEVAPAPATGTDRSWATVLAWLCGVMVLWVVALSAIAGEVIPPVVAFGLLYLAGIFVVRRWPRRAGPLYVLVVSVLITIIGGPFAVEALPHPESALDFIFSLVQLAAPLAAIAAAIGALRSWGGGVRRALVFGTAGVVVALAGVSLVAAASLEDDVPAARDLRVVAEDVEFAPDALIAEAGTVAVFVDNQDPARHTFTIDELGVDLEVPASTARRVEFTAQPGTYEYFCNVTGHEDMKGEIVVTG